MMRHLDLAVALSATVIACGCSSSYTPRAGRRLSIVMSGGQLAYVRDGRMIEHGLFGGGLEDAVRGVPEAEEAASVFHHRMVGGFLVGMGGLLCSTIAMGRAIDAADHDRDASTEVTVGLGCLVGSMAGLVYLSTAPPYMYDAINMYNDRVESAGSYPPGPPGTTGPPR